MKKVLILGATGMLGHTLYYYLKENTAYHVTSLVFRHPLNEDSVICDVTDRKRTESIIKEINPNVIINCIGILIRGSNNDYSNAIYINAFFPHLLSDIAEEIGAKLIHISTDCVFSGKKGGYVETDFRDADDLYGRTKALGELENEKDLTIRTSIVGPELKEQGEGLLHWFLNQTGEVNGFTKALWGGVTTLELSKAIAILLQQPLSGIIHLTNGKAISKFDLLNLFSESFPQLGIKVNAVYGKPVDKSLSSIRNDISFSVSSYSQMVAEMKDFIRRHESIYEKLYKI
jgi:dTDP-4-dehydrorhamnose reductase